MPIRGFFRRLVADAPLEISACEFKCHKTQCRHGEWAHCDFRLRGGLPVDLPEGGGGPAAPADREAGPLRGQLP
jgi:hypothetical protein